MSRKKSIQRHVEKKTKKSGNIYDLTPEELNSLPLDESKAKNALGLMTLINPDYEGNIGETIKGKRL